MKRHYRRHWRSHITHGYGLSPETFWPPWVENSRRRRKPARFGLMPLFTSWMKEAAQFIERTENYINEYAENTNYNDEFKEMNEILRDIRDNTAQNQPEH